MNRRWIISFQIGSYPVRFPHDITRFEYAGRKEHRHGRMTLEQIKHKANAGDRRAQAVLAKRYEIGFQVRENNKQAFAWYRKSAEQGFAPAQWRLGEICRQMHLDEKLESMDDAIHWYEQAANQGSVTAQLALGNALEGDDPQDAAYWFDLAAKAGDAEANFRLAELYGQGNGVPQNDNDAFQRYLRSEQLGFGKAAYEVGRCYATGCGVEKNSNEALTRLLPIADPRITEDIWLMSRAQFWVFIVFGDAEHAKHDLVEAYVWLNLAASYAPNGQDFFGVMSRESLVQSRDLFSQRLSKEQITAAQNRSAEIFVPRKTIEKRLHRN